MTDVPGVLARIDELVKQVDELPAANAVATAAPGHAAPKSAGAPATAAWWQKGVAAVVEETLGDRNRALAHAKTALSLGYSAIEIKRNPDLDRLRQDSRMPPLPEGG